MSKLAERVAELVSWVARPSAWHDVDLTRLREAALRDRSGEALAALAQSALGLEREQLVGALVRQVRRTPARVWTALLIIAAAEWLVPLAERFAEVAPSADDVDATVVEALLEVVVRGARLRHARVGTRRLKLYTRRQVIAWLRARGDLEGGESDEPRPRRRPACERSRRRMRGLGWAAGPHP